MSLTIRDHWKYCRWPIICNGCKYSRANLLSLLFPSVLSTRFAFVLSNRVQWLFSGISIQYRSSCEHLWTGNPCLNNCYFESPDMETVSNNDFPLEQLCCEISRQLKSIWSNKSPLEKSKLVCQCLVELSSLSMEILEIVFLGLAACTNSKI